MSQINCDSSIRIVFKTVTLSHPDSDILFFFVLLVFENLQQICTRYSIVFFYESIETCFQVKLFLLSTLCVSWHIFAWSAMLS